MDSAIESLKTEAASLKLTRVWKYSTLLYRYPIQNYNLPFIHSQQKIRFFESERCNYPDG
jgi:hypothetical protein